MKRRGGGGETSFEACSVQHKDRCMLQKRKRKTQATQSLQYDKKTVYMFFNIFVLYYIQLSLLKMEYR